MHANRLADRNSVAFTVHLVQKAANSIGLPHVDVYIVKRLLIVLSRSFIQSQNKKALNPLQVFDVCPCSEGRASVFKHRFDMKNRDLPRRSELKIDTSLPLPLI